MPSLVGSEMCIRDSSNTKLNNITHSNLNSSQIQFGASSTSNDSDILNATRKNFNKIVRKEYFPTYYGDTMKGKLLQDYEQIEKGFKKFKRFKQNMKKIEKKTQKKNNNKINKLNVTISKFETNKQNIINEKVNTLKQKYDI
eukprot:TRINITY_DN7081_c0_g1_i2.p3 TRINITY_DN7081_c0_g1~~TRINITY_DN7081_c0_g1_i2.p3  ORF type:complete len:142 (-),score=36.45 TRINITY_DN7081_c0_g1_i2:219-644(-)